MPRPAVHQKIDRIESADQLIKYAVASQISLLPGDITQGSVAKAAKMDPTALSKKLSEEDRSFSFQDLRNLDQALVALSPRPDGPLQHVGGLRSLGARVRGLQINEVLAEAPAEWTDEWVRDSRPPQTEFDLLGRASALLTTFMAADRAGRRQADLQTNFEGPTRGDHQATHHARGFAAYLSQY